MTAGGSGGPKTRRKLWAVAAVVAACALAAAGIWIARSGFWHEQRRVSFSECMWAHDVADPRVLVGIADDVFLGRVVEQSGSGYFWCSMPESASPYSLYRVEVLKPLKGHLSGVVEVTQLGGIDKQGTLDLFEGDPLLKPGELCLFVTRGSYDPAAKTTTKQPEAGRPAIVSKYGDVRIDGAREKAQVLARFMDAVRNQVHPEDDIFATKAPE